MLETLSLYITQHPVIFPPKLFLKFFSFNARSLLPKLDELSAICSLYSPDIVCIVETWRSPDICDSELSLPNFQSFRLDRSRHGGGILVYVKSSLSATVVPTSSPIELLLLSITFRHVPLSLATFYRPPSCPDDLCSLQCSYFSSSFLLS